MTASRTRIRADIQSFAFDDLFIEELGWDRYTVPLDITVNDEHVTLTAIAEKRGMVALTLAAIPDHQTRRKIEQQVAKAHRENIIIYTDPARTRQVWQWVRRETGRPLASRERDFQTGQSGENIAQILAAIAFDLDEEDTLTIVDVTSRVRAAFDMERVTKKFYDRFKKQHDVFLQFIEGIPDEDFQRWYASVMLNRLMFIYFVQKKGFLDGDTDYLRNRLAQVTGGKGRNFYRDFLCPLFFEGFAQKDHSPETRRMLGDVPYLNGGLFLLHQIEERYGDAIAIANEAFEKLFDFFDEYRWHLDERPLRADNEINPDVLGYIFEKYINQKQMGAYYTKEDITEYISKNTVIPFLFDAVRQDVNIAFEGEHTVWDLLAESPDRYIYPAVRHGVEHPLPENIATGLDDVSQRGGWNTPAPSDYALPTEIWREVVARRSRYADVRGQLARGEVRRINDLITLNLDIQQFAQDVIQFTDSPDVIRAFWQALNRVTVLDPTCGSGAFLFAALNILEPLYEACLERMEAFLSEWERVDGPEHHYPDFRAILARIEQHPNRRYLILKSIIVNNLFGVDIMEEAVEIAKLRLFLKLVAQVDDRRRIEPLPDIDFNIRAGNTLVGYATEAEIQGSLFARAVLPQLEVLTGTLNTFRREQLDGSVSPEAMADLKARITGKTREIAAVLDEALAPMHGFGLDQLERFRATHKPFHWYAEFYGVLKNGGFDVIIGNPPYVEYSKIKGEYQPAGLALTSTGNLYSICLERFINLVVQNGLVGVIVPISSVSTPRMKALMRFTTERFSIFYTSNFAVRPDKLFVGVDMNLSIFIGRKGNAAEKSVFSTQYNRWYSDCRPNLFQMLSYGNSQYLETDDSAAIPKVSHCLELNITQRAMAYHSVKRSETRSANADTIYYHSGGRYFRKAIRKKLSNEYKELKLQKGWGDPLICLLSSSLYYLVWIVTSDTYHVTKGDIYSLTVPESLKNDPAIPELANRLLADLWEQAEVRIRNRADGTQQEEVNFKVGKSKPIIDEIDRVLARHYGFTDEELDFIINYDIKYRMGDDLAGDEGE